jgi:hypothetical protein
MDLAVKEGQDDTAAMLGACLDGLREEDASGSSSAAPAAASGAAYYKAMPHSLGKGGPSFDPTAGFEKGGEVTFKVW